MVVTTGSKVDPVNGIELIRWFDWARRPWGPLMEAERQFDALIGDNGDAPRLAAYDTFLTWPIGRCGGSSTMRARIQRSGDDGVPGRGRHRAINHPRGRR